MVFSLYRYGTDGKLFRIPRNARLLLCQVSRLRRLCQVGAPCLVRSQRIRNLAISLTHPFLTPDASALTNAVATTDAVDPTDAVASTDAFFLLTAYNPTACRGTG